ncbi:MAG: c-type cytochrome [Myxococcales bacterium]|nr:c-type cytochrome [Myxococcales bacterium]
MPLRFVVAILFLCSSAVCWSGCESDDDGGAGAADTLADTGGGGGVPTGEDYYNGNASAALGAAGNEATCSLCHSNNGDLKGFSGNSFKDIAFRTAYKGGMAPTLLDGANACVTGWMGGKALTDSDPEWAALKGYLESISSATVTTPNSMAPEVLDNEAAYADKYGTGGDAAAGEAKFATTCGGCHGADVTVGTIQAYSVASLKGFEAGRIAQKVRTSGPPPSGATDASDSTPGPMPFFELPELSEQDLKDIVAYLKQ